MPEERPEWEQNHNCPPFGNKDPEAQKKTNTQQVQQDQMAVRILHSLIYWLNKTLKRTHGHPPKATELTNSGWWTCVCPVCNTQIKVRKVGIQNYYEQHQGSAQGAINKKKRKVEDSTVEKTKQNVLTFFQPPSTKSSIHSHSTCSCDPTFTLTDSL